MEYLEPIDPEDLKVANALCPELVPQLRFVAPLSPREFCGIDYGRYEKTVVASIRRDDAGRICEIKELEHRIGDDGSLIVTTESGEVELRT